MQVFNNTQFGDIRVAMRGREPWFVAIDVCRELGIKNVPHAISRLDADERGLVTIDGGCMTYAVSASGLYSLVFNSDNPKAKTFQRWIVYDVIPSIYQREVYLTPGPIQDMCSDLDIIISLATQLKEAQTKIAELTAINAEE